MSTLVADRRPARPNSTTRVAVGPRTVAPAGAPRRPDQLRGPNARPVRAVPPPSLPERRTAPVRACRVEMDQSTSSWHLTERGMAVVLVVALMLAVAAVTVIGLTAVRVTSPTYQTSDTAAVSSVDVAPRNS